MKLTVKQEYEQMKDELRFLNRKNGWDMDINLVYHIEHFTTKSKKMFLDLLNQDFARMNRWMQHGFITTERYNQMWKVWNDCSRSIANMVII